jgi:hypothetical protein
MILIPNQKKKKKDRVRTAQQLVLTTKKIKIKYYNKICSNENKENYLFILI